MYHVHLTCVLLHTLQYLNLGFEDEDSRAYVFAASSENEMLRWIRAIRNARYNIYCVRIIHIMYIMQLFCMHMCFISVLHYNLLFVYVCTLVMRPCGQCSINCKMK